MPFSTLAEARSIRHPGNSQSNREGGDRAMNDRRISVTMKSHAPLGAVNFDGFGLS
jgi:hypothetical protein